MSEGNTHESPDRSDQIEGGLRAAFGPETETDGIGAASVLRRLRNSGASVPQVSLRDLEEEPVRRIRTRPGEKGIPDRLGRYQLLGEIARGGVGVVYKARDVDLGRYLAIKILLEKHRGRPEMTHRFIEEAQIAGQLQHPGVAPIHELGIIDSDLPYFAMRLINGRTLSALLRERPSALDDRSRFLAVFERVAETLAYANARGVIHRDLKPSNIMVGAFGEVQVMDWGLAKVLAQGGVADEERAFPAESAAGSSIKTIRSGSTISDSVAGSVLGTPAYMAPEQARGEIGLVDERSDVFGLGAILCEILTGEPPFTGSSNEEVHRRAKAGDLGGAFRRLAESGADEELVDLATRCLAVDRFARPRDAGVVSREAAAYRTSLDERARRSELEAAEARVKALEERKARRRTIALAATVVVAVSLVATVWVSARRREDSIKDEETRAVERELGSAKDHWETAKSVEAFRAAEWRRAVEAARRANELVTERVDDSLRTESVELFRQVDAEGRLLEQLEEIRLEHADDPNWGSREPGYGDAFREFGVEVDVEWSNAGPVIEELRATGIGPQLASAFDHWAMARRRIATAAPETWKRLLRVARAIDPDPWRSQLRTSFENDNLEELRRLARRKELLETAPPSTIVLLASSLIAADRREDAEILYWRAWQRHRDDFWINHGLGYLALTDPQPRHDEALLYFTAALVLRPHSAHALRDYGVILQRLGKDSGAKTALGESLSSERNRTTNAVAWSQGTTRIETDRFSSVQMVALEGGPWGDAAFDPKDSETFFVGARLPAQRDDGIYRVRRRGGEWIASDKILTGSFPSDLSFGPDGALWIARTIKPYVYRVTNPGQPASQVVKRIIEEFQTNADDDPIALAFAPPGFDGPAARPGDLIIADTAVDDQLAPRRLGIATSLAKCFYAFTPSGGDVAPDSSSYRRFLVRPETLRSYFPYYLTDFTFSRDGASLYALFAQGRILEFDAAGRLVREIPVQGDVVFGHATAITAAADGRLWISDDHRDEIWSVDAASGLARREIAFLSPERPLELSTGTLTFSPDGKELIVGEHRREGGRLWIFRDDPTTDNRRPVARIAEALESPVVVRIGDGASLTLDGSDSDDGDGGTQSLSFRWTRIRGPESVAIEDADRSTAIVHFSEPGVYTFALEVDDGRARLGRHSTQIVVYATNQRAEISGRADGRSTRFDREHLVRVLPKAAEVAFDPTDNALYAIADRGAERGGGVYRIERRGDSYRIEDRLIVQHKYQGISFTPNGDLWLVRDREGPHLVALRAPLTLAPHRIDPVIWNFGKPADDDPRILVTVPPGFVSDRVSPGDLIIGDCGFDTGFGQLRPGDREALHVYRPRGAEADARHDLRAFDSLFVPPDSLRAYHAHQLTDLAFARDGAALYALYKSGQLIEIDPRGEVVREVRAIDPLTRVEGTGAKALAVDPLDGRIWIAREVFDSAPHLLSLDPQTGEERVEIVFYRDGAPASEQARFPSPSLRFSPDGRLVVTDASGWLWIFEKAGS